MFGLVFYHGWTQDRIGALFRVDERTVRRWQSACPGRNDMPGGDLPPPGAVFATALPSDGALLLGEALRDRVRGGKP